MNEILELAVQENLSQAFPKSRIYRGSVIQNVIPNSISITTYSDEFEPLSWAVRNRHTFIQVTINEPTYHENELRDILASSLQSFYIDGQVFLTDDLTISIGEKSVVILVEITHREVLKTWLGTKEKPLQ